MDSPQTPGGSPDLPSESTGSLLRRVRAGDRAARERLYGRYLPALRRWARGRLPRWARGLVDTSDIIQDTLARTLGNLDRFEPRGEGALVAYLHRAVHNRIRDELRRLRRQGTRVPADPEERAAGPDALEELVARETLERYEKALGRLPDGDREAIVLRVELGFDYDELAEALGRPSRDAARMAVGRALVRLAREMRRVDDRT